MPTIRRKRFFAALRPWILGMLGVLALGFLYYFLATLGPRRVSDQDHQVKAPDDPVIARLSAEVGELEKQYRFNADAGLFTPEAQVQLTQAIDKQKELLRRDPRAGLDQSSRLTWLESELDGARAKEKKALIERLEREGEEALAAKRFPEAGKAVGEALRLQREINGSTAGQRYKNYVRETSLAQRLSVIEAEPIRAELEATLVSARQAAAEKRWADALAAYTSARALQGRLNRDYGRTLFADLAAADRLDAEIDSLNAAGVASEIDTTEKAGDEAAANKRYSEAARQFSAAHALQLQVNQNFPKSRFVSSERIENLEAKRQTALSSGLADDLERLDHQIAGHLLKRQVVAAEQQITEAVALVDKLFSDFPKSRRLDGAIKLKFAYLALRRTDLRALQDEVYDRLLPLPGVAERLLLKTEVSQSLYVLVMNTNPSRNPGRALPVDSVNWNDAQEFCARLSWLLGAPVRLPTADEFRIALGDSPSGSWTKENSKERSQETGRSKANASGFFDLLGNMGEWLAADVDADKAPVGGGSYLDPSETLVKMPMELRLKSDRARHVGFRILLVLPVAQ